MRLRNASPAADLYPDQPCPLEHQNGKRCCSETHPLDAFLIEYIHGSTTRQVAGSSREVQATIARRHPRRARNWTSCRSEPSQQTRKNCGLRYQSNQAGAATRKRYRSQSKDCPGTGTATTGYCRPKAKLHKYVANHPETAQKGPLVGPAVASGASSSTKPADSTSPSNHLVVDSTSPFNDFVDGLVGEQQSSERSVGNKLRSCLQKIYPFAAIAFARGFCDR